MLNKKYWLMFIAITSIAIFSRAIMLLNASNYYFQGEQAAEYLVTKSIVVDHKIVLTIDQGGFGGFSKGPGFSYLLAIPFILTRGDPFGGRLLMFAISVLTVSITFIFATRMLGIRTAIIISFLLAVSPNLRDYAVNAWPPFVIPFLTIFYIFFLFKVFYGQKIYIPFLVFVVGLMTHFEIATAGILLLLLIITGSICLIKRTIPYYYYLLSVVSFTLSVLSIIIFDIQNNFYNLKGVLKMIEASKTQATSNFLSNFGNLINNRFEVFSWNFISTFSPNLSISLLILVVILLGTFLFVKDREAQRRKKTFVLYLGLIPLITFIFLLVYPGKNINQWWITDLTVIYCFLLGIILNYFWKKNTLRLLVIIIFFVLSIAYLKRTHFLYKTQFAYPPSNYIKEDKVIKYIFEDAKGKPFGILTPSSPSQAVYDYLIWWNGDTKYHYQPHRTSKGLFYIIIEPNIKISIDSKKYINLRTGKLIKTTKLDNGFIIEKNIEVI